MAILLLNKGGQREGMAHEIGVLPNLSFLAQR